MSISAPAGSGPSTLYPFEVRCHKCSRKELIHSPERAIKSADGQLKIISDYKADLAREGLSWQQALESGRIQNIFRFVCKGCGKQAQVARPYDEIEPGCVKAGWLSLAIIIAACAVAGYFYGLMGPLLVIPTAPFIFFIGSALLEIPYKRRVLNLRSELRCENCPGGGDFLPLSEARSYFFNCPGCGNKSLYYSEVRGD